MITTIPGKIPIRIQPVFWLLVLLISAINGNFTFQGMAIWAVIIVVSVVAHEFGHALTAVAYGQRANIDLVAWGGLTHRHGPHLKLSQEFWIVLNGPLAGLTLALFCFLMEGAVGERAPLLKLIFGIGFYANVFWTAVNLLPIQPLDGGHLLRIICEGAMGLRGIKIALFISFISSLAICILLFVVQFFLLGIFFMMFTYENYRAWRGSLALTERDKDDLLLQLMKSAEKDYHKGNDDAALQKIDHLRTQTKKGVLFLAGSEMGAEILSNRGRYKEAYRMLLPLKASLKPESLMLLHKLAYRLGEHQEAIALGTLAYQRQPTYEAALMNAFSYALRGEAKPAVGWLQCAVKEGLPNLQEVLKEMEFNSIRSDPSFQQFVNK